MENTVDQILAQFRLLSDKDKNQLIHKLRDEVERKNWISLLESLVAPELSEVDILKEVETVRAERYTKSS